MKKIILGFNLLFVAGISFAQTTLSTNENYVYSKSCMDADCIKKSESVQYFDGLGRPIQSVAIKATPLGRDVVMPIEYDSKGRQAKNYYPVPQNGSQNGALYADPLGNAPSAYGNEKIYTENRYDNLFVGRVNQVVPAGNTWSQKPVTVGYGTNIDNEVRKYAVTTSWVDGRTETSISQLVFYAANQLGKNTVTDPDGNTGTEFKNGKGETILVRKNDGSQNVDTYYLYNEYGQLTYVIPPLAVTGAAPDQTMLDNLCYQYRYDGLGRLVEKKVPGKGWEYMVYDKQDRLVAVQDANLRQKGQWLYTKYDKFGRVTFTGIFLGGGRGLEQVNAEAYGSNNVSRTSSVFFNREGMDVHYDPNGTYPVVGWVKLLSVNYYDTYPAYSFNPPFPSSVLGKPVISDTGNAPVNTKTMPTLSLVKNIEDDNWTKNYAYYDAKGRLISTYAINHLDGYTRTETELDFAGVTQQSKVYHKRINADKERVISQSFDYDNQNRLIRHRHQVGGNPVEILAENTYNELSQITNKKVGGGLESMDYQYDIRGALTKINDPAALGNKLFGYELKYQNPAYTNIAPGKSNGNISEIDWKSASDGVLKRYSYTYDPLNRLKDAVYTEPNTTNPYNNYYNEYATYDLNGNIKTLKRNAFPVTGTTATQVDDLVYQYTGNRLDKVIENALNDTGYEGGNNLIDYDLNGNMTNMKDKGIQTIGYNVLDLQNQLSISVTNAAGKVSTTNIDHIYGANGAKLRKTTVQQAYMGLPRIQTTDYLDGFQYTNIDDGQGCRTCKTESAYEEQAYRKVIIPVLPGGPKWTLDFIPTAEGFYSFTENRYIYQYKDHLGNVRVSFARNSAGAPEITGTNNYYPFGLNHIGGGNISPFSNYHSYKFGGKELQETGMYDFGARMYMPDLGRWGAIDPMAEAMRRYSPYNYAFNNPISFIDPDGMKPRQFAMPTDARPDAPSGWTNPNWLGFGNMSSYGDSYGFGSIETGISDGGDGSGSHMSAQGLLATVFAGGGRWENTGSGFSNGTKDVGYDGNYINTGGNDGEDGVVFNVPEVIVTGKKKGRWSGDRTYPGLLMYSKMTGAMMEANFDYNSGRLGQYINNSKASREVAAVEKFLFLELPGSFAGGELLAAGWRAAGITKLICRPLGRLTNNLIKVCFTQGTLVAVKKGNKKIEDIKEGDLVWSYNEKTGVKELKKVVALSRNISSSLVKILVNGTEIICTPEHPFYVEGMWIEAKDLITGMLLTTLDEKTSLIESVKFLEEKVKVYNFEVEDNHNYYVSEKGILVHNNCEKFLGLTDDLYAEGQYFMYSKNYISGNTYTKSISTLMKATESTDLNLLIKTMFNEAKSHGAKILEVRGTDIMNNKMFNEAIARRLGFTFEKLSESSIRLTAPIP